MLWWFAIEAVRIILSEASGHFELCAIVSVACGRGRGKDLTNSFQPPLLLRNDIVKYMSF